MNTNTGNNIHSTRGPSAGGPTKLNIVECNSMMMSYINEKMDQEELMRIYSFSLTTWNNIVGAKGSYNYLRLTQPYMAFANKVNNNKVNNKVNSGIKSRELLEIVLKLKMERRSSKEIGEICGITKDEISYMIYKWRQTKMSDEDILINNQIKGMRIIYKPKFKTMHSKEVSLIEDILLLKLDEVNIQTIAKEVNVNVPKVIRLFEKWKGTDLSPEDKQILSDINKIDERARLKEKSKYQILSNYEKNLITKIVNMKLQGLIGKAISEKLSIKNQHIVPNLFGKWKLTDLSEKDIQSIKKIEDLHKNFSIRNIENLNAAKAAKEKVSEEVVEEVVEVLSNIDWVIRNAKTHYLKYNIRGGLSIRTHIAFDVKPEMIGKFIMKNHDEKLYQTIDKKFAMSIINGKDMVDSVEEIRGSLHNKRYEKYILIKNQWVFRNDEELDNIDSNSLWVFKNNSCTRTIGEWEWSVEFNNFYAAKYLISIKKVGYIDKIMCNTYDEVVKYILKKINIPKSKLFFPSEEKFKNKEL